MIELSIVIPAYNESRIIRDTLRRVVAHLAARSLTWEIVIVDDGSRDGTAAMVASEAASEPRIVLLQNPRNQGKGASVKNGMLAARGSYVFFMDADLSVPLEELDESLDTMIRGDWSVLIGSRRIKGSRLEKRQPKLRELMGDTFTLFTRLLLDPSIRDFTCGFKGFRRAEVQRIFSLQRSSDWAFDAEILYLAHLLGIPVYQRPVRWRNGAETKVRFPRDIIMTLIGLVRIRLQTPAVVRGGRTQVDSMTRVSPMVAELPRERDPT